MSPVSEENPQVRHVSRALWACIGIFFLLSIPFLFWPFNSHPDERLYTVAAAEMIASGDYLIPKSETGEVRLKKPVVPYYYVVAGFWVFGETVFAAKILMVLSAGGIIALTYALARALGAGQNAAVLGAALVGGHKIFFSTSNQHIPDMPLVLGISAALLGFVYILKMRNPSNWVYYLAWLGVAFAVLAKGMLVLLLVALYIPFRLAGAWGQRPNVHEIAAICIALFVSVIWFAAAAVLHPEAFVAQFIGDQVTAKVGSGPSQVLAGLQKTSLDLTLPALPILAGVALAAFIGRKKIAVSHVSRATLFLIVWCIVTVVVFAFSTQLYERYILPALPAFAGLIALASNQIPKGALTKGLGSVMWVFLTLPILAACVSVAMLIKLGSYVLGFGLLGAAGLVLLGLWLIGRQSKFFMGLAGLALVMPLLALSILPLQHVFLFPVAGQQIAQMNWPATDSIIILDEPRFADDIGLQIGGIDRFQYQVDFNAGRDTAVPRIIFLNPKHLGAISAAGYDIETRRILRGFEVDMSDIKQVWTTGKIEPFMKEHGETLYIAQRR